MARNIGDTGEHKKVPARERSGERAQNGNTNGYKPIIRSASKGNGNGSKRIDRSNGTNKISRQSGASADLGSTQPTIDANGAMAAESIEPTRTKKRGPLLVLVIAIIAVAIIGGWFGYSYYAAKAAAANKPSVVAQYQDDGKIYAGISALDIELGGMSKDDANAWLLHEAKNRIDETQIEIDVDGKKFTLSGEQMGAYIDVDSVLQEAISYGREGDFLEREAAVATVQAEGLVIPAPMTFDETMIKEAVEEVAEEVDVAPTNASFEFTPTKDENSLMTSHQKEVIKGEVGHSVDQKKLVNDVYKAVSDGKFDPIKADVEEVEPEINTANIDEQYTTRGTYTTKYTGSRNRHFNIWKMCDAINTVRIEPGEEWSMNEQAGPRTYELGWKGAPGILDGAYVDEAGGGICQVSTTLYGAVIRSEVEITDRSKHSWRLSYAPGGLDATISTGAPDFKIRNNYDVPIYILASCDGNNQTVTVSIYGPPFEDGLTRDFTSELVGTNAGGGIIEINDPTLPQGQRVTEKGGRKGETYRVDKIYKDKDGNIVKREDGWKTESYAAFTGQVRVGTGPAPTPDPTPPPQQPQPDPPTQQPQPEPPVPDPEVPVPEE